MPNDNNENISSFLENSSKEDKQEAPNNDVKPLRFKERLAELAFCMLLVIIGIVLALVTRNQWWLTLLLGPFLTFITKKGE